MQSELKRVYLCKKCFFIKLFLLVIIPDTKHHMTLCCHRSHGTSKCEGNSLHPFPLIIEMQWIKLKGIKITKVSYIVFSFLVCTYYIYRIDTVTSFSLKKYFHCLSIEASWQIRENKSRWQIEYWRTINNKF